MEQLVAIRGREFGKGLLASSIPRPMHDLLKGVDVHCFNPSIVIRQRSLVGACDKFPTIDGWPLTSDASLDGCAVIGQFFFGHLEDLGPLVVETAVLDFLDAGIQAQRLLGEMSPLRPAHI